MPEPRDQVGEGLVLHDDRHAAQRRRLALPARDRRAPLVVERLVARAIRVGVRRIELGESRRERRRDPRDVARIGLDVRIAGGMHVAVGAIEPRGLVQQRHECCAASK